MKTQGHDAASEVFVHSVLESVRRRKYLLLIPTLICTAAAAIYSFRLEPVYRSEALLRAEAMLTANDYADTAGTPHAGQALNVDENFRSIQELVRGRTALTTVITEFRLYDLLNGKVSEASLEEMKERVLVRMDSGDDLRNSEPRFMSFRVGFEDNDRNRVWNVANRLAGLFVKNASIAREQKFLETLGFIEAEMAPVQKALDAQSERIKQYKQSAPDSLPEHAAANLRLLEGLRTEYLAKTENMAKDQARRAAIVDELHELEKQGALETVTPVEEKTEMAKKLDDLRMQYRQMQARYLPDYPELGRVKREIAEVEQLVPQPGKQTRVEHSPFYLLYVQLKSELEELDRRAQGYGKEQQDLTKQMAVYRSRFESAPIRESELAQMVRDYTATQAQYQELLERQHNAQLAEQYEKSRSSVLFRIIDPARPPSQPVSPQRRRLILFGILGGLGLGIGLAFFSEQMDSAFHSIDDYQKTCDIPVLATIPSFGRDLFARRSVRGGATDPRIVTLGDPQSIPAEQYRILAMKLQDRNGEPCRTIAVTSAAGGEGKTLTAVNLAVALCGQPDRKVLLIDANLRQPRTHEFLRQSSRPDKGFADLLSDPGDVDVDHYIRKVGELYFIPGIVRGTHSLDLLISQRAREVLRELRTKFQFIILDAPAILPIADSIILSSLADEVLLVLNVGKTPRELFLHAIENLDTANIRGVVLNHVDIQHSRYAHAYRYYRKNYGAQQQ